jgi:hypothetical protein
MDAWGYSIKTTSYSSSGPKSSSFLLFKGLISGSSKNV